MKKNSLTLLIAFVFISACSPMSTSPMTEAEARQVAEAACIKGSEALALGKYDEPSKTWSFDANLNATQKNCIPICVVSEEDQKAHIEWRCEEKAGQLPASAFGIYLAETGELIFSEEDIVTYEPATAIFTLTETGAQKIKSPLSNPELLTKFYKKEFVVKIDNEEIYRGRFWSPVSSASEPGIIMEQALLKETDDQAVRVKSGYASTPKPEDEKKINDERILNRFKELGKLIDVSS